jgi:hypothetical protein
MGVPGPKPASGESVRFFQNISEPSTHRTVQREALAHLTAVPDGNLAPDLATTIPYKPERCCRRGHFTSVPQFATVRALEQSIGRALHLP